jgi:FMN phosphatase YigB (HAD superfamily)
VDKPKTIFCDLDGTLVKHTNPIDIQNPNLVLEVLPGVHEKLIEWDTKVIML